jgi:hypothetical protein
MYRLGLCPPFRSSESPSVPKLGSRLSGTSLNIVMAVAGTILRSVDKHKCRLIQRVGHPRVPDDQKAARWLPLVCCDCSKEGVSGVENSAGGGGVHEARFTQKPAQICIASQSGNRSLGSATSRRFPNLTTITTVFHYKTPL